MHEHGGLTSMHADVDVDFDNLHQNSILNYERKCIGAKDLGVISIIKHAIVSLLHLQQQCWLLTTHHDGWFVHSTYSWIESGGSQHLGTSISNSINYHINLWISFSSIAMCSIRNSFEPYTIHTLSQAARLVSNFPMSLQQGRSIKSRHIGLGQTRREGCISTISFSSLGVLAFKVRLLGNVEVHGKNSLVHKLYNKYYS